jgi:hypothetical protein
MQMLSGAEQTRQRLEGDGKRQSLQQREVDRDIQALGFEADRSSKLIGKIQICLARL